MRISIPLLYALSLLFLFFPNLLFWIFWVKIPISIALFGLQAFTFYYFFKQENFDKDFKTNKTFLIALVLVALTWCLLSGIGGYFFQRTDYDKHNAIFKLLINNPLPITFEPSEKISEPTFLNYYLAYYLPTAIFSKFIGIEFAEILSLSWATLGISLVLIWLLVLHQKTDWRILVLFIGFTGLDVLVVIGQFLNEIFVNGFSKTYIYQVLRTGWEVQLADRLLRYMGNVSLLVWTPQHAIGTWLGTALVWHQFQTQKLQNVLWIWSFLLLWSPMAALGLGFLIAFQSADMFLQQRNHFFNLFSWTNGLGSLGNILISTVYFLAHFPNNIKGFILEFTDFQTFVIKYLIFVFIQIGVFAYLILPLLPKSSYRNIGIFTMIMLCILPFYKFGFNNDLMINAGISLQFVMCFLLTKFSFSKTYPKYYWFALWILMLANPIRNLMISVFRPFLEPHLVVSTKIKNSPDLFEIFKRQEIVYQYLGNSEHWLVKYWLKK